MEMDTMKIRYVRDESTCNIPRYNFNQPIKWPKEEEKEEEEQFT